jgi:hypothetical protein
MQIETGVVPRTADGVTYHQAIDQWPMIMRAMGVYRE